jgi:hypothetical protein
MWNAQSHSICRKCTVVAFNLPSYTPLAVRAAKTMVLTNQDVSLKAWNKLERQIFASLFKTADQREA